LLAVDPSSYTHTGLTLGISDLAIQLIVFSVCARPRCPARCIQHLAVAALPLAAGVTY